MIEQSKAIEIKDEIEASNRPVQNSKENVEKAEARTYWERLFVRKGYPATMQHSIAIEFNPTDASYLSNRSVCYLNMNDYLSATIRDTVVATKVQPTCSPSYFIDYRCRGWLWGDTRSQQPQHGKKYA
mmetsp:Transcript_340/g.747  ORF Transcript_340/g.747 Transcript_340/m.747 type:complete len:128 (+) Transcript_340:473-856(+)